MRKRILVIGTVAAVVTGTLVAAPAQAGSYACDTSHVCLWVHANYEGTRQQISGFAPYTDLNGWLHDNASSWGSSTRSQRMCVINWVSGSQQVLDYLSAGERVPWVGSVANDRADAVRQC